jgi:hypothetical protein
VIAQKKIILLTKMKEKFFMEKWIICCKKAETGSACSLRSHSLEIVERSGCNEMTSGVPQIQCCPYYD